MSHNPLIIRNLSFAYPQSPENLFEDISLDIHYGWTGIVGSNGSGKTTLLKLITRQLIPEGGNIQSPPSWIYCDQEAHVPPEDLEDFYHRFYSGCSRAGKLFSILRMDYDWPYRWDTLSFGERKRAQLASALIQEPEVLALDEPSNHLDENVRQWLLQALLDYRGIGLLVSHDRYLMDQLCMQMLMLHPGAPPKLFRGSWSKAMEEQEREQEHHRKALQQLKAEERRLKNEAQRRRESADKHKKDFSKKHLDPKDRDGRARIDAMRLTGKDGMGNALTKRMTNRLERLQKEIQETKSPEQKKRGVTLMSADFRGDFFFQIPQGNIALGEGKTLQFPDLSLSAQERISLTGVNGSGKTTLIREILKLSKRDVLYLPQEISPEERSHWLEKLQELNPKDKGEVLSHFSRLNGDPSKMKGNTIPSPGETRKLILSLAFFKATPLLILDEPTNHLDLPSRMALEEALTNFTGAVLLVSHDKTFREKICGNRSWAINDEGRIDLLA